MTCKWESSKRKKPLRTSSHFPIQAVLNQWSTRTFYLTSGPFPVAPTLEAIWQMLQAGQLHSFRALALSSVCVCPEGMYSARIPVAVPAFLCMHRMVLGEHRTAVSAAFLSHDMRQAAKTAQHYTLVHAAFPNIISSFLSSDGLAVLIKL